jgi:hypothetical protein
VILASEGDYIVEQARYTGTHTGPLRSPDGAEIPATGKTFDFPFVGVFRVQNGKISSIRIFYDQIEVLHAARADAWGAVELTSGVTRTWWRVKPDEPRLRPCSRLTPERTTVVTATSSSWWRALSSRVHCEPGQLTGRIRQLRPLFSVR